METSLIKRLKKSRAQSLIFSLNLTDEKNDIKNVK